MASFGFGDKNRKNYQKKNKTYDEVEIVAEYIVKPHKSPGYSRQLAAELVKYSAESRNNKSHYEYDYKDNKCEYKDGISHCPFDFSGQFIATVKMVCQLAHRFCEITTGFTGQDYCTGESVENPWKFRNTFRERLTFLDFLRELLENLLKP